MNMELSDKKIKRGTPQGASRTALDHQEGLLNIEHSKSSRSHISSAGSRKGQETLAARFEKMAANLEKIDP